MVDANETVPATNEDFAEIDIRVGEFKEVWKHPESDKLYCEKIDLGDEIREIASGLQQFIPIDGMKGLCIVFANLKPRKLAGFNSNGMILCASNSDHTKVELLRPDPSSKPGERVTLEGFDKITQEKQKVLNPKKKTAEKVLPCLKTDNDKFACFNGGKLKTSAGYIVADSLSNSSIS